MNRDTFAELLGSHRDQVYSYAYYFLRDREEAEDVTQEVFLRLWRSCRAAERPAIEAWLWRSAHNLCIDLKRRSRTARRHVAKLDPEALENIPARPGETMDPETSLEITQTQRIILEALGKLPAPTQSAILLHYYRGLGCREIGRILATSESTIRVRIHRGRRALRRVLAEKLDRQLQAERKDT